jgi:hypothetical protein
MEALTISVTDETAGGKILHSIQLEFPASLVTVAEIIEKRVFAEVNSANQQRKNNFYGLVQPDNTEITLNGFHMKEFKTIDPEKQSLIAKGAFGKNGFFILIDDIQAESLEQTFFLHKDSTISFIKLTPLVGG